MDAASVEGREGIPDLLRVFYGSLCLWPGDLLAAPPGRSLHSASAFWLREDEAQREGSCPYKSIDQEALP